MDMPRKQSVRLSRILTLSAALSALLFAASCNTPAETAPTPRKAPKVYVVRPVRGEIDRTVTLPGDAVGYYEVALHAKVTGYIKDITVDKGDTVKAGALLCTLDVPELHSNLARAKARMDIARITYQRVLQVWNRDPRLVAKETVDENYAKWKETEAEYETLETMVGYTQITAPFSGVITGRYADPGALIRAGASDIGVGETSGIISSGATEGSGGHRTGGGPILSMAAIDKIRIYSYVPDDVVSFIKQGTDALLYFDELPTEEFHGKVTRFAKSLDLATRTMMTEVNINNPNHEVYPRMYAHVTFVLEKHDNALLIPTSAASVRRDRASVFVVADGKLKRVLFKPGLSNRRIIEVLSGLTEKDLVVKYYSGSLSAGQEVRPITVAFDRSWQGVVKEYSGESSSESSSSDSSEVHSE
jgi:membrane fusion protein (multidrug efflux system)